MSFSYYLRYGLTMPPHIAAAKMFKLIGRIGGAYVDQVVGRYRISYAPVGCGQDPFKAALGPMQKSHVHYPTDVLRDLCAKTLNHQFDLLGSGWVRVDYNLAAKGFADGRMVDVYQHNVSTTDQIHLINLLSPGNRKRASCIRELIDVNYSPIDWQVDFKSGFRWSENRRSNTLRYGHEPGVDVKVPWELARLHHLPWLAFAYHHTGNGEQGFQDADVYRQEFCNQVLDFAAANPPGFGVNWLCTMDVAIRAANMLLAFDLLKSFGAAFDEKFLAEFESLICAHGVHIRNNLEWHEQHRANHYLADIAGLCFVAVYLSKDKKARDWLEFSTTELISEVERQFTSDGANFEASTSYHRLSAEMVVYTAAIIVGHHHGDTSIFPDWFWQRLEKMAEFTIHCTKPDGQVVQIGDNDNGRFFKILPTYNSVGVAEENHLNHISLVAAINGFFGRDDFLDFHGMDQNLCAQLIYNLSGGANISGQGLQNHGDIIDAQNDHNQFQPFNHFIIKPLGKNIFKDLNFYAYPNFGLYIWSSENVFFSMRLGPVGQNGNGGHGHNDQLSFELMINGEHWARDPGTYIYTAKPKRRDQYRSVHAHTSPKPYGMQTIEPSRLDLGLFKLENNVNAHCLKADQKSFIGLHGCYGKKLKRSVTIKKDRIIILDEMESVDDKNISGVAANTFKTAAEFQDALGLEINFSPGYGLPG